MDSRPATSRRGFTLIELVLVMMIIGMMLAIIAPSLAGMLRNQRIDGAARTVAAMLQEARARAASDGRPYRVVIDTEDNTAWLESQVGSAFERPQASYGKIVEFSGGLTFELEGGTTEDSRLMIRVEPDGVGELAQVTLIQEETDKTLAVYNRTPMEPYRVGVPITRSELETGGMDDVQTR